MARLLIFLFLIIPTSFLQANTVALSDFMPGVLHWDPVKQLGKIEYRDKSLTFIVNSSFALNSAFETVEIDPFTIKDGEIITSENTKQMVIDYFRPPQRNPLQPFITSIFIDPGHGGKDPGTVGRHWLDGESLVVYEKDVVLNVARQLQKMLVEQYPDKNIHISRDDDSFVVLEDRAEMANSIDIGENEAVLFISIHANAAINKSARGFEVWFLPPTYKRTFLTEDDVDVETKEILSILNVMKDEEITIESALLAKKMSQSMEDLLGSHSPNRGIKQENFVVVRESKMPAILVELGFVSNKKEAQLMSTDSYLQKLSQALYNGVTDYVETYEK